MDGRWSDYFLRSGPAAVDFWAGYLREQRRDVLVVMGAGFDPRMCAGIEALFSVGGEGRRDCIAIEYHEGPGSASHAYAALARANRDRLAKICAGYETRTIDVLSTEGRRIADRSTAQLFSSVDDFADYTDVVVDISALPRGMFFPLLAKLLYLFDGAGTDAPNLHVLVSEAAAVDDGIADSGVAAEAVYVHGFSAAALQSESKAAQPTVWLPIIGPAQRTQLERTYDLVTPDEICPVLPSPALNPRRADDLVIEYRDLLFDQLRVEPQNFVHVAERNPFEAYRQMRFVILRYKESLSPLGGCKAVVSAFSSKLSSVGAVLAAYELNTEGESVGVAHVEATGYTVDDLPGNPESTLFSLWLTGECYENETGEDRDQEQAVNEAVEEEGDEPESDEDIEVAGADEG